MRLNLSTKNELEYRHSGMQPMFSEEIGDGKITVTLVKAKGGEMPVFHVIKDLQIREKVPPIIKVKFVDENNTDDEEELLPGNWLLILR